MIDRETQQKIKDAANILEVVGDYVKLTRRGANYMGLCPFHNEKTPSFSVSPRKNFCHCFSCKKGGSPVNFLMEKEGISYTEALLLLAKKYNIPVEERELSDEERERLSEREAMIIASEWAMNYFHDNLYGSEEGRDIGLSYLYERGVTDESIRKYKLGYSIDRGDALLSAARKAGFDLEILKKIGLVGTSQQGKDYDKFRGRVMFPIRNASGKPIAFGGRALKGELAKYINSPETPLYKKSNELYGIFEAKSEIIHRNRVYLMEGYLDVIGSWQAGLRNAVASSGTALTESQIALIHRFTENVTLIYDGDQAGIKASLRGIDMLLAQKLHVKVLLLPDGEDPDSFARKNTPAEFQKYLEEHQTDFIHYKLGVLLKNAAGNPQEISEAVRNVVNSIASIPDEIERISYIKECAGETGIEEKVIARQVAQALLRNPALMSKSPRQDFVSSLENLSESKNDKAPQKDAETSNISLQNPYFLQEKEIVRCCVRYGFLPIPAEENNKIKVIDYIAEEMHADGITFNHEGFQKIFNLLKERNGFYEEAVSIFREKMEERLNKEKEKFREVMRISGGSLSKIKREEEKFDADQCRQKDELIKQFSINFSIDFLINHEDSVVREIVNPMIAEKHTLSSIYMQSGSEKILEEDKLSEIVPRALSELRSEILNNKSRTLQQMLVEAVERKDYETQEKLMSQIGKLLQMRKRFAEDLGERVISPR